MAVRLWFGDNPPQPPQKPRRHPPLHKGGKGLGAAFVGAARPRDKGPALAGRRASETEGQTEEGRRAFRNELHPIC